MVSHNYPANGFCPSPKGGACVTLSGLSIAFPGALALGFPTGLSFRVRAEGGVGSEGEEPSRARPMKALELTPRDVSAAGETDVAPLARKRLRPPLERGVHPEASEHPRRVERRASPSPRARPRGPAPPPLRPPRVSPRAPPRLAPPPPGAGGGGGARSCGSESCRGRARRRPSRS